MKKLVLLVTCLLMSMAAHAVEFRLGGWSHHFGDQTVYCAHWKDREAHTCYDVRQYNEVNKSIGIEYKNIEVSTMINSYRKRSYTLGYHFKWNPVDYVVLGTQVGAATGYADELYHYHGLVPMVHLYSQLWFMDTIAVEAGLLSFAAFTASVKLKF